ncbi:enoyl-ACP reductase FabI [Litoribrevibacter albus]|uniref:Enoyl-[acyl-carrier-protein] reductase [NADH] n=1 Tax=Litoribrevibacter albus TaxID=1473156 RepID=A0AA37SD09_9GAMM|nr:enoyl-ACP reductase [Litoribrevibacter albus]GLQ32241.1 enoyl-[acyl-carrier-protein] reductase [NADH] [Litoribrevibacter albus]
MSNATTPMHGLLQGKRALIVGLASKHSIAKGIADAFHAHGAELALTYQTEKLGPRIKGFAEEWNCNFVQQCDLSKDEDIESLATALKEHWGEFDIIIHSVGYAPVAALDGSYLEHTTREDFKIAHEISSYSFTALASAMNPMIRSGGSLLTLSYHGSQQVIPNYNVMGLAKASLEASVRYLAADFGPSNIRVNSISAGPIKTLAAAGIKNFRKMLSDSAEIAPLGRGVTIEEVGNTATFLCSDMASGITGEIVYVDGGLSKVGTITG